MQRVLDIDLDFFVYPVIYNPSGEGRPQDSEHSVLPSEYALNFLQERCGLVGRTPGFVTTKHDQLFQHLRSALENGSLHSPFHVTHIDAHADLGFGQGSYRYVLPELLKLPVDQRQHPVVGGPTGLNEGNFLLFALACRWLGELDYVYGIGAGSDVPRYIRQGFAARAPFLQLPELTQGQLELIVKNRPEELVPVRLESPVPFREVAFTDFQADAHYDFVCITRSPTYTPPKADALFDEIIDNFIDPIYE